jgi:hypothetical protein
LAEQAIQLQRLITSDSVNNSDATFQQNPLTLALDVWIRIEGRKAHLLNARSGYDVCACGILAEVATGL